jgi:hypothetical protein
MIGLLRLVFRLVAVLLLLLAAAFVVLVAAVLVAGLAGMPLGQVWLEHDILAPVVGTSSEPLFGAIIERRFSPALWNPGIVTILNWPSWLGLLTFAAIAAVPGWLLFALTARRRRRA